MRWSVHAAAALLAASLACQSDGPSDPDQTPQPPPPGPHFTHSPVPVESLARITPIGYNNKIFPVAHTYWLTCDIDYILQGSRPCVRRFQTLVAPGNGVVRDVNTSADGFVAFEGPPGLLWHFGHVTPAPGLARGSTVTAGQTVATMFYDHGFDFGVVNFGVHHSYIVPTRYPEAPRHAENPIAQFPDSLRALLLARVNSLTDSLGRLSFDMAGTASGGWFTQGSPRDNTPLQFGNDTMLLWLARYVERRTTRIAGIGKLWPGMTNRMVAVDSAAPDWESITPTSGAVALRLWNIAQDARPNLSQASGTLLVQLLDSLRLRVEWFNTHNPVTAFTAAARMYER